MLRADMNEHGYDVPFTCESLKLITMYMALTHNHFAKAPSSDMSPLEFVAARRLSKPHVAMYGMVVLAELPSSLVKDSPNETRNIEAMYLPPRLRNRPSCSRKASFQWKDCSKTFRGSELETHFSS